MDDNQSFQAGMGRQAEQTVDPFDNDFFLIHQLGRHGAGRHDVQCPGGIGLIDLFPRDARWQNHGRIFRRNDLRPAVQQAGHGNPGSGFILAENLFGRPGDDFCNEGWPCHSDRLQQAMAKTKASRVIPALLSWYDRHRRDLPWRQSRDPYRVWLSEIMLQQTTVPAVIPYFLKFTDKYPTVKHLANAPQDQVMADWAGLGYYSRARNLHAAAKAVADLGSFPDTVEGLKTLPGIGDYTAGAIAAIAYDLPATVVDGNVERVMSRVEAITDPLPASKPLLRAAAALYYDDPANTRPGDLPQAFMDLGATICTPAKPKCMICPINDNCEAYKLGIQETLPARTAKAERPKRKGYAYWITNKEGQILLHRRPAKGLLGGMVGLPTSDWNDKPAHPDFITLGDSIGHIKHVFTHFELRLDIFEAKVKKLPDDYFWADMDTLNALPSVFKKAAKLMN